MKKNNCVCFGVTASLIPAVANIIIGIESNSKNLEANYVIMHLPGEKFNDNDLKALYAITSRIEFKEVSFTKYEKLLENTSVFSKERYGGLILFSKYFIFDLLNEYHNVLWLDADILIQGDITPIFSKKPMAWRPALRPMVNIKLKDDLYKFTEEDSRPNGGVIFVSDEIPNYDKMTDECFNLIANEIGYLPDAMDELVFGVLNHKFSIGVNKLHPRYNAGCGWQNSHRAIIVHSIGSNKFWNSVVRYSLFHRWRENNSKWVKLGGTNLVQDLKGKDLFLGDSLNYINTSLENCIYWNSILSDISYPSYIVPEKTLFKNEIKFFIKNVSKSFYFSLKPTTKAKGTDLLVSVNFEAEVNSEIYKLFFSNINEIDKSFSLNSNNLKQTSKTIKVNDLQTELDNFFCVMTKYIESFSLIHHIQDV